MNEGWADKVQPFLFDKRSERDRGARPQLNPLVRVLCLLVCAEFVVYFIETKLTDFSRLEKIATGDRYPPHHSHSLGTSDPR